MSKSEKEELKKAVSRFREADILVIGDIIVDHFIWGSVSRISPEAPVPVVNVTHENLLLGGAANVVNNIYSLGARASLCGIIGNDEMGNHLLDLLKKLSSPINGIIVADDRPTTVKTRILAQHQQVVRFDREQTGQISDASLAGIREFIDKHLESFDAVIISDYAKGMISAQLMAHLLERLPEEKKIPIITDPKPDQPERFKGVTILTPNHNEAELMTHVVITDNESMKEAARTLRAMTGCKAILITRGKAGMALFEKDKPIFSIPTVAKEVFDVTGAGDTVAATLALGLATGLPFTTAATMANYAAGIVVGKIGTSTTSTKELLEAVS